MTRHRLRQCGDERQCKPAARDIGTHGDATSWRRPTRMRTSADRPSELQLYATVTPTNCRAPGVGSRPAHGAYGRVSRRGCRDVSGAFWPCLARGSCATQRHKKLDSSLKPLISTETSHLPSLGSQGCALGELPSAFTGRFTSRPTFCIGGAPPNQNVGLLVQ